MKKLIKINKETLYLVGYFLMGLSAVVIGNSYLFGVNRFQICEVVQYLSATIFLWSFCIDKYKIFDFVSVFIWNCNTYISNYHARYYFCIIWNINCYISSY